MMRCEVPECKNKAQWCGKCDKHNGRTKKKCIFPECTNFVVSNDKCIKHGGGKRCEVKDCLNCAIRQMQETWCQSPKKEM